jgi:glycosyltransferase involved in cell wall biosynthesis
MATRTEQEIMKNWKNDGPPLVSVVCITYNHEPYIRDAIEGFLMQETDFPFEIIIHDDASTDRTVEIISEYKVQYPNLIKPIYQKENQFSQGRKTSAIAWSFADGEYIAFCEGDDYWINPYKLQAQIILMKMFPSCHISFHPAVIKNATKKTLGKVICNHSKKNKIFSTSEVIKGEGGFCPTASLVCRKAALLNIPNRLYNKSPIGDYIIQIYGSLNGGALFINQVNSVYNSFVANSWSMRMAKSHLYIGMIQQSLETLDLLDMELSHKYSREITYVEIKRCLKASIKLLWRKEFKASYCLIIQCFFMVLRYLVWVSRTCLSP